MKENFIPIATGIIFLIIGIICLFWSEKIQEYVLKMSEHGTGKFNPFIEWMKSKSYILSLRIIGVLGIIVFVVAFFVVFKK